MLAALAKMVDIKENASVEKDSQITEDNSG